MRILNKIACWMLGHKWWIYRWDENINRAIFKCNRCGEYVQCATYEQSVEVLK